MQPNEDTEYLFFSQTSKPTCFNPFPNIWKENKFQLQPFWTEALNTVLNILDDRKLNKRENKHLIVIFYLGSFRLFRNGCLFVFFARSPNLPPALTGCQLFGVCERITAPVGFTVLCTEWLITVEAESILYQQLIRKEH